MITCNINGISHWFHFKPTCQSKYLLLQLLYHLSWSCWLERKLSMKNMYVKDNIHQAIIFNYKGKRKSNEINISLGGYTSTWLIIVYTDSNQKSFTSDSNSMSRGWKNAVLVLAKKLPCKRVTTMLGLFLRHKHKWSWWCSSSAISKSLSKFSLKKLRDH